jgi:hypothetical protein
MHLEPDAERQLVRQVAHQRRLRVGGILFRVDAQVQFRAGVRRDGIDRVFYRRDVDPDDGNGTPGRTLPMSPMIMTSAPNISGFCGG